MAGLTRKDDKDCSEKPGRQVKAIMLDKLLIRLINAYQSSLSFLIGNQCRFYPTCSQYTIDAIKIHGSLRGSALGIRRICSCHPFHEGGHDPVPESSDRRVNGLSK